MNTEAAEASLGRVHEMMKHAKDDEIEVIIAHDKQWMQDNPDRFFPGTI